MTSPLIRSAGCALAACLAACSHFPLLGDLRPPLTRDVHTHAEPERVRVRHLDLDLALDFATRRAEGMVELVLERSDPRARLVLDSLGLEILGVEGADGTARDWRLGAEDPDLGSALSIRLEREDERVRVRYRTTGRGQAMQWLAPEQTADGTHPFLFTQGQSILTRSWIPVQDSPGVRVTYTARINAPAELVAVMSAEQLGREGGAWTFRMDQPIPPYLIALACGRIEFRPLSERAGVWAEPSLVDAVARELEDTEAMIASAEDLFGPYRWERYDMIVLPPAFPFGGMENPRLTFLTPTMFAGDKSLVALIAHELAHSWSGNLVTNATWSDFWLNEGTTVYFEQRIMEAVYGKARSEMEQLLALADLERELEELARRDQILHVDLRGRHPDDGFSGVPYDKGALFLRRLEEVYGRPAFDAFLRGYFEAHAFRSLTTPAFEAYLETHLLARHPEHAGEVDVHRWLYEPGLPETAARPRSRELERAQAALAALRGGTDPAALDTDGWVTQQWLYFLEGLPPDLGAEGMAALDRAFGFTRTGNHEILAVWLRLAVRHGYPAAQARLEQFLHTVGRRKFLKPLYTELARTPEGLERARTIYARARPRYHAVSRGTIDEILGLTD